MTTPSPRPGSRSPLLGRRLRRGRPDAGFTLPELLLASVLGALLLTSLAATSYTFTESLDFLEVKAGIPEDEDAILGRMTKDIREAYHAELLASDHIRLYAPSGEATEYFVNESSNLSVKRPNGDVGIVFLDLADIEFTSTLSNRKRESVASNVSATFVNKSAPATPALPLVIPSGGGLSLAFSPPVSDLAIGGSGDEQLLSADPNLVSLPIAWIEGDDEDADLVCELYESWGPGSAKPSGAPLGSIALAGSSIPAAVEVSEGVWSPPSSNVSISLASFGASLEPGVGYCIVVKPGSDAQLVTTAHPFFGGADDDDVGLQVFGSGWVTQPFKVPFSISGTCLKTSTAEQSVVSRVSISMTPENRPTLTRSAALLSQALSDDPWLGAVPGEAAP